MSAPSGSGGTWPRRSRGSVHSPAMRSPVTATNSPHSTYESFDNMMPSPSSPTTPTKSRFYPGGSSQSHSAPNSVPPKAKATPKRHSLRMPPSVVQAPWDPVPSSPGGSSSHGGGGSGSGSGSGRWGASHRRNPTTPREENVGNEGLVERKMGMKDMSLLTVGLAGAQLTWCVEMAFGTPYLLSLGLSKQATSLVWLAGPMSGLLIQPLIGSLSDSTPPPYRRRLYILLALSLALVCTLLTAFAIDLAGFLMALTGLGDWDPEGKESVRQCGIALAVAGFWGMDFGLNGVQAGLRALILDMTPVDQYATSNAYHGRMTHIGNLLGYTLGYLPLASSPLLAWLGGGQFRRLACLSCLTLLGCVALTCWTQDERERPGRPFNGGGEGGGVLAVWRNLKDSVKDLQKDVKRVCMVQFFAWTAFFPFLFYSTTYIAQLYPSQSRSPSIDADEATRLGSLSLLCFSIVALITGILLPALTTVGDDWNAVKGWPKRVRYILARVTPRNCWTFGLLWFFGCMVSTFWVGTVEGAMTVVACCGVSWAIACWVPFALVMESIRTASLPSPVDLLPSSPESSPSHTPPASPPLPPQHTKSSPSSLPFRASLPRGLPQHQHSLLATERTSLLSDAHHHSSLSEQERNPTRDSRTRSTSSHGRRRRPGPSEKEGGGTTLGIHNLSIVAPQFFVALVSAGIFRLLEGKGGQEGGGEGAGEGTLVSGKGGDVVWVLRFGGLAALGGVIASRWLIETASEKRYVAALKAGNGDDGGDGKGRNQVADELERECGV